jgi:hypothetical protein
MSGGAAITSRGVPRQNQHKSTAAMPPFPRVRPGIMDEQVLSARARCVTPPTPTTSHAERREDSRFNMSGMNEIETTVGKIQLDPAAASATSPQQLALRNDTSIFATGEAAQDARNRYHAGAARAWARRWNRTSRKIG